MVTAMLLKHAITLSQHRYRVGRYRVYSVPERTWMKAEVRWTPLALDAQRQTLCVATPLPTPNAVLERMHA